MTIDAALALADRLELGVDGVTDLLGISLSAHDIVAHTLGPHSPEVTAMTIAEDREIARLLRGLAKRVPGGLGSIVIALTADHGGPSIPEDVASTGSPAHVIDVVGLAKSLEEHLDARFPALASSESWIAAWTSGNVWLNPKVVRPEMPEWPTVLDTIARHALSQENGYVAASTVTERTAGRWPYGALGRQLGNQVVEGRSGHVILIPAPNVFEEKSGDLVSHVTGYTYDRLVPLMISGPGVRPGVQATRAELVDVAPTLSFLLGILPPAGSTGRVLHEGIDPTRVPW
jgi:predicted AlkP superfamily pyrophosphatase or phosphodiesterase